MSQSLNSIPLVNDLARLFLFAENNAKFAGLPKGMVRGRVVDVDDPENLGRVRVIFDAMNPGDIPEVEGAGLYSQPRDGLEGSYSHWIDACPAFVGKQPPGLVGKRVNIILSNGQYHYALLNDVIYDPQNLTDQAASSLEIPNNSTLVRIGGYPSGNLPPANEQNRGCTVIELDGPMNSDWLCTCLKRNGEFIWVRHCDLQHGHAGANDSTQPVDSSGNRQSPSQAGAVWDKVYPTSAEPMKYYSAFGTAPRGNPWGSSAEWNPPPMSNKEPRPVEDPQLLGTESALNFVREGAGFIGEDISGSFTTTWDPKISSSLPAIPGINFAKDAITKAQNILSVAETARKIISDPTKFIITTASSALQVSSPQATKFIIDSINNPQATINTVYSSLKTALNPFK